MAAYCMLLVPLLALATARGAMMKINWVARLVAETQIKLNLQVSAADRQLITLSACARKAYEIWSRVFLNERWQLLSALLALVGAAGLLMLGFEVEFNTIAFAALADAIVAVLRYSTYVLVITCECRFRLRLLSAAPMVAALALYTLHDIVLPSKCYYTIETAEVLSQAYWPFPSLRAAHKRKRCATY
ncbi:MAG: hypothetical protein AAJB65_00775 [Candidatus Hodgkinia cicadicola]